MSDPWKKMVECQVCHRVDFSESAVCSLCDWPIRPLVLEEPVYGFDVCVQIQEGSQLRWIEKHFKTSSEARARAAAKRSSRSFVCVLAVRPLTETQYIAAYGALGRM